MANFITVFRVFLVFIAVYLLFTNDFNAFVWAFALTSIAFILDGVDGYVARKLNETSKLGSVIDIIGDRVVENVFWVVFAALGWLPAIFPIISLTRSFVVDGLRSVAMEQGYTAFGEMSMQDSKMGYLICSSKFSRITYAVAKLVAFLFMILAKLPGIHFHGSTQLNTLALIASVVAIEFCVIRGLPVVFASKRFFKK